MNASNLERHHLCKHATFTIYLPLIDGCSSSESPTNGTHWLQPVSGAFWTIPILQFPGLAYLCHRILFWESSFSCFWHLSFIISRRVVNWWECLFGKRFHKWVRTWILKASQMPALLGCTSLTIKWVCFSFAGPFIMQQLSLWNTCSY